MKKRASPLAFPTHSNHPNIIILVLDAVRAKNVSAYGYPIPTTPHLDAFAAKNLLFKHAFAPATWTIPTHASMLSGLYLSQHRIENIQASRYFNSRIITLPQVLLSQGYRTAAFSQNLLFSEKHHLNEGFNEFYQFRDLVHQKWKTRVYQALADSHGNPWRKLGGYLRKAAAPRFMFDIIYQWLSRDNTPSFVMINIANAHYPWSPPLDILWKKLGHNIKYIHDVQITKPNPFGFNSGKRKITPLHREIWHALYDAAILHLDRELGRFLHRLQRWANWSNTIMVVTADHGELLGEHLDIVGHTLTLHDNVIHVPFVIRHPDYTRTMTVEGVVQTLDLYSSILEWTGISSEQILPAQRQRPSLSQAIENAGDPSGIAFAEEDYTDSYNVIQGLQKVNPDMPANKYPRQQVAARSANHKYIWLDDRSDEFYDLTTDPMENRNLINTKAPEAANILALLKQALETWRTNLEIFPPRIKETAPIDPEVQERLRTLGYLT